MQFLQVLKLVVTILPLLIDAIKKIEEAVPGQGKGEQKLAAVRNILEAVYDLAPSDDIKFDAVWPAVQKTIGAVVGLMNSTGTFQKQ